VSGASAAVTIRPAVEADAAVLCRLAELDSAALPRGRLIVAEVDGEIRAAVPVDGGDGVADPFFRCTELTELLRLRSRQLRSPTASRTPPLARLRGWPRATPSIGSRAASKPRSAAA
jgi:hypothetical protein